MKSWHYGINSLYKTGHIIREEAPWYIFAIDRVSIWFCDHFPPIPFPSVSMKDDDGEETTWKEYYGDARALFHIKVCMPIFEWVESKKKTVSVDVPYDILKEKFYETDKKFFDEEAENCESINESKNGEVTPIESIL
ncbi:MAG: hypothetical protein NTZ13_01875 [Candidatus Parcubacteria bacterium]|nr:hypothetical protein [Candidatus Parcubacteria bacterium]